MATIDQTTTPPVVFNFGTQSIRTIDKDGEVWFVASDVCAVLEVTNPSQAVGRLDDDERSMLNIGRQGDANIINESGLYSLVLSSRKEQAKAFKRWVTHDVLPAIRKTGLYEAKQAGAKPTKQVAEAPHPRHIHSAEEINERIDRRALQLSLMMSRKFVADMRKPSQFHYFRTGDNAVEGWLPSFGSGEALDVLRMIMHMAGDGRKHALEADAEWEALMDESLKVNGMVRVRKEYKE